MGMPTPGYDIEIVDEDGNYDYDNINAIPDIDNDSLCDSARLYRLRYKSRKHFIDMNKIEYNYTELKQKNETLHNEFRSYYKIFSQLLALKNTIPYAIAINEK